MKLHIAGSKGLHPGTLPCHTPARSYCLSRMKFLSICCSFRLPTRMAHLNSSECLGASLAQRSKIFHIFSQTPVLRPIFSTKFMSHCEDRKCLTKSKLKEEGLSWLTVWRYRTSRQKDMMPEDRGADHIVSMVRQQKDMTACSQLAISCFTRSKTLTHGMVHLQGRMFSTQPTSSHSRS